MVSLYFMMMVVIVLTGIAGYTVFATIKSSETMLLVQRNVAQMDMVATRVRNALEAVDNDGLYPPMGAAGADGYTVVPAWVATDASTPWGVSYSYCPYAPSGVNKTGDSTETVTEGAGGSYSVNVADWPDGSGPDFVVGGAQHPDAAVRAQGVLALIVSPVVNATSVPDCSDVTYADGAFKVDGGTVVALRDLGAEAIRIGYKTETAVCGSADGSTCTASCTGGRSVLFGECPSNPVGGSPSPLVSFGSDGSKESFTCTWADGIEATVTMAVTCAKVR